MPVRFDTNADTNRNGIPRYPAYQRPSAEGEKRLSKPVSRTQRYGADIGQFL
jgi:hypothetical protein